MGISLEPYLVACLLVGMACGFESQLAGRRLAIGTHLVAAVIGFYGLGATDMIGEGQTDFSFKILYALVALFLACAWIAETDSLRSNEPVDERGDAANHVIAFAVGLACAMQCETLVIVGCIEMFALFLKRAQKDCKPMPAAAKLAGAQVKTGRSNTAS